MKSLNEKAIELINSLWFYWKRNNWVFSHASYKLDDRKIISPIFLIGNQGGGLTLLSRMLRRNNSVVSVTGNSKYWAGASEMQNVYELILPRELSGIRIKAPKHKKLTPPRSWSYACNDLINLYRKTEADANKKLSKEFKRIIALSIKRHGGKIDRPRFIDKSQSYSVKVSFINELLKDCNPYFIHVTRNPYATIYRAASGKAGDMKRYSKYMNLDERFEICLQHWYNTANCIEEDKYKINNYLRIKFEDILLNPNYILKNICEFINLKFSKDMIPQQHHKLPLGTTYKERWYPLRVDVNDQYLNKIPKQYVDRIFNKCGRYAEMYGYSRPLNK